MRAIRAKGTALIGAQRTWASSAVRRSFSGGDRDAYLPTRFAEAYARALPDARLEIIEGAGHRPWIDGPSVVDRILDFVS
jgi:pimeloyl-ACP methyl ester carboxylesterase